MNAKYAARGAPASLSSEASHCRSARRAHVCRLKRTHQHRYDLLLARHLADILRAAVRVGKGNAQSASHRVRCDFWNSAGLLTSLCRTTRINPRQSQLTEGGANLFVKRDERTISLPTAGSTSFAAECSGRCVHRRKAGLRFDCAGGGSNLPCQTPNVHSRQRCSLCSAWMTRQRAGRAFSRLASVPALLLSDWLTALTTRSTPSNPVTRAPRSGQAP